MQSPNMGTGGQPPPYAAQPVPHPNPHVSISYYPPSRPQQPHYHHPQAAPQPPHYATHPVSHPSALPGHPQAGPPGAYAAYSPAPPHAYPYHPGHPGHPAQFHPDHPHHPAYAARLPTRTRLPPSTVAASMNPGTSHAQAPPVPHHLHQPRLPQQQHQHLTPQQKHYQQLQGGTPGNPANNYVYIFSTELANQAAKAVDSREVSSLIEFHKKCVRRSRDSGSSNPMLESGKGGSAPSVKKEISSPVNGGGSASSGYESSATPPMQLQPGLGPSTSSAAPSSCPIPLKSEPSGASDLARCSREADKPLPSPQSVPPPPKTPLTPLGRANSVNPTNGPSTPQSVPPPQSGNGPSTPGYPASLSGAADLPHHGPASVPPPAASFSAAGDDPLSKMARLANDTLPREPPLKRTRLSEPGLVSEEALTPEQRAERDRDLKMRRVDALRGVLTSSCGPQQPPQYPGHPQPPHPHMVPHPQNPNIMIPSGYQGGGPMMMEPGYGPPPPGYQHHPGGPIMMMRPPPGADPQAQAEWEKMLESHNRQKQAEMAAASQRARAPVRAPLTASAARPNPRHLQPSGPSARIIRPPAYAASHHEQLILQQQQQHFMHLQHQQGGPRPPHMLIGPPVPGGRPMGPYGGEGPPPPEAYFHPQHQFHPHMGKGGVMMGKPSDAMEPVGSMAGEKPTVNNTFVNATMTVQQLNILNPQPPMSAAQVVASGAAHVSLSVPPVRGGPKGHPPPASHPPPAQLRPHNPAMGGNGDLSAIFHGLTEAPITNLDSKVPSKTLQYRPSAPAVETPPAALPPSVASVPDLAGLLGPNDGEDSFGFDSFDAFQPSATFSAFSAPDTDLSL